MITFAAGSLLRMLEWSLVAGVGVIVVFAIGVFGVIRAEDMRRSGRGGASAAFATLATVALLMSVAATLVGLIAVTHKG